MRRRAVLPGPGHVVPPADLGPEALAVWRRLAPAVARLGLIHGDGAALLAEYCRLFARCDEVQARARRVGFVVETPVGMKVNPKYRDLLRLDRRLLRLGSRLGMTPLARTRLGLGSRDP